MSALRQAAGDYLAMRRCLGYALVCQGRLLMDFVGYLERTCAHTVTAANAVAWATQPAGLAPVTYSRRLSVARCFARHLAALDPACQVPPTDLLPARNTRPTPYLYSQAETAALVRAAGTLAVPLQAATSQALVSLLAASGLRLGEALALARGDVDLAGEALTVTGGKPGAARRIPLHPTTAAMLSRYAARRDRLCPAPATDRFFVSTAGTPLAPGSAEGVFAWLLTQAGIATPPGRRRPRIHDLRHSFAVATLLDWYRAGADVRARLPLLSAMLGHAAPASTYYYLTATPELLALAGQRLGEYLGALP